MKAIIFHNPACGTSRKTPAILRDALGIDVVAMGLLDAVMCVKGWMLKRVQHDGV